MADRLRYVGTWLSLVEHSLGVRGVGSSNLPVPTNSSFSHESQCGEALLADPRSTPTCIRVSKCTNPACEGREAQPSELGSSNLPVPTIKIEIPRPLRRTRDFACGLPPPLTLAKRRQFKTARSDPFKFPSSTIFVGAAGKENSCR